MRLILTDVDDTILECADVLQQFLEGHGYFSEERLKDHHDIPKLFNISMERTLELVSWFHRSGLMTCLQPEASAAVVLPELYRAGYRFVAITACLDEPEVVSNRRWNLREAFGFEWEAIHCLGLRQCKKDALNSYPASIWVDDLGRHAAAGAEAGHRSFLIDRPYNRIDNHPDVVRVTNWNELAKLL